MGSKETESYKYKLDLSLGSTTPIVGCEMTPHVSIRPEGEMNPHVSIRPEGLPTASSYSLNFKWYKEQSEPKICSTHRDKLATVQCISCFELKIPAKDSYHCSTKCFVDSWETHLQRHRYKTEKIMGTSTDDKQTVRYSSGSLPEISSESLIDERALEKEGNKWFLVSCLKSYSPQINDLGLNLKLECVAVDFSTGTALSETSVIVTNNVMGFPTAQPRRMVRMHESSNLRFSSFNGTFSILSYNILLSNLCRAEKYPRCPPWALVWEYRRQNLLREIIDYGADIICLQEVRSDHFVSFFKPELTKNGYSAIYKNKTSSFYADNQDVTDGCATFYRCGLFKEVMKYEIEYDKETSYVIEALQPELRNKASIRLKKDNVALVIILETLEGGDTYGFRSRICVVNTHICANTDIPDVKLFQVVTLINELEKILQSEIPILICGDFNSAPKSDPHTFIVTSKLQYTVDPGPYGICHHLKLHHRFSMASAYAKHGLEVAAQKSEVGRFDPETGEPTFTSSARNFSSTLDYIFFTVNSLRVEGLLKLLDPKDLHGVLPSPLWSSDHIALMASFRILTWSWRPLHTAL